MATKLTKDDVRAMRIAELMDDFRGYVSKIVQLDALCTPPTPGLEKGETVVLKCRTQAQALISAPFKMEDAMAASGKSGDQARSDALKKCMLDACCRRLVCLLIAYRSEAGARWRNRVLQVQKSKLPTPQANQAALKKVDEMLQTELAAITYPKCFSALETKDKAKNYWMDEMPNMATMTNYIKEAKLIPS